MKILVDGKSRHYSYIQQNVSLPMEDLLGIFFRFAGMQKPIALDKLINSAVRRKQCFQII